MSNTQEMWSSRLTFILAATGSAVGLGNVWKFPYMVGEYGGSAFVLLYLLCIALVGIPLLQSELLIGRRGGQSPSVAFANLARKEDASPRWSFVGYFGAFSCFIILSFYSVVGGWSLHYVVSTVNGSIGSSSEEIIQSFNHLTTQNWQANVIYHSVFLALTAIAVMGGIRKGIERVITIIMPLMFVLLAGLLVYSFTLPGFNTAIEYLFTPDFSKLAYTDGQFDWGRFSQVALSALGHSLFTLSVGMTAMIAYSIHLPKNTPITKTAFSIAAIDTAVAMIAGIAIYSIVFSDSNLSPNGGPGLVFITIPQAFANIAFGYVLSIVFFTLLWLAAWSSAMSILETQIEVVMSSFKLPRKVATVILSLLIWAVGLSAALSYNLLADTTINNEPILDFLSNLSDKVMLPLSALMVAIFSGWVLGMNSTTKELGGFNASYIIWRVCVRLLVPAAIACIFIFGVKDWLF